MMQYSQFYFISTWLSPLNVFNFYVAGNFFLSARALIGYFGYLEVTSQLTMKLFPAKISERVTLQNLWRQGEQ